MHRSSQFCWGTLIIHVLWAAWAVPSCVGERGHFYFAWEAEQLACSSDCRCIGTNDYPVPVNTQFSPDMHMYMCSLCTKGMIMLGTVSSAVLPQSFCYEAPRQYTPCHSNSHSTMKRWSMREIDMPLLFLLSLSSPSAASFPSSCSPNNPAPQLKLASISCIQIRRWTTRYHSLKSAPSLHPSHVPTLQIDSDLPTCTTQKEISCVFPHPQNALPH